MIVLLVIQLIVMSGAVALLWWKLTQMSAELRQLRAVVESMELDRVGARKKRVRAEAALTTGGPTSQAPPTWAPERDTRPADRLRPQEPPLVVVDDIEEPSWRAAFTPTRLRRAAAVAFAASPALTLFFLGLDVAGTLGLAASALLFLVSLRQPWREAAWIGALGSIVWTGTGLVTLAADYAPLMFAVGTAMAGVCGLLHLRLRETTPGALTALAMSGALLILGARIGMDGPAGGGFALLVAVAAIIGAWRLRLEPLHIAAFVAALAGLFIHSAQESAAIWFTPAAAIAGALFLGIAIVRVPVLGSRGVVLAGTAVGASLFAVGALYVSQQGLANPYAAAVAFVGLAAVLGALTAIAAQRRPGGVNGLKGTLWVLSFGAFAAFASGVFVAFPAPLAATAMAMAAACLALLDTRVRALPWRAFAIGALAIGAMAAGSTALAFLSDARGMPRWLILLVGFAAPALFAAMAARTVERNGSVITSDLADSFAVAFALAGGSLALRYAFAAGAPQDVGVGFLEAGAQIALWLGVGVALAISERRGLGVAISVPALVAAAVSALLWLTPYWLERPISGVNWAPFQHAPLGFLLIAIAAWAQWAFWRARDAATRTRVAYGAAALASAAFIVHETVWLRRGLVEGTDWVTIGVATVVFALALTTTMAPGFSGPLRPRYLRKRA